MKNILLLVVVFSISACQTSVKQNTLIAPKPGDEFAVKYGEQVTLQNAGMIIKFKSVDQDSRCPEGAKCDSAGNAKIVLEVTQAEVVLNTNGEPNQTSDTRYHLKLKSLSPFPKLNQQIKQEEYVAKLVLMYQ